MAGQQETDIGQTYMTFGPSDNELSTTYQVREGAHVIVFANRISPDMVIVHQSKLVGFYVKMDETEEITPVTREVKDLILRDNAIVI